MSLAIIFSARLSVAEVTSGRDRGRIVAGKRNPFSVLEFGLKRGGEGHVERYLQRNESVPWFSSRSLLTVAAFKMGEPVDLA